MYARAQGSPIKAPTVGFRDTIIDNIVEGIINANYKVIMEVFVEVYLKVITRRNVIFAKSQIIN